MFVQLILNGLIAGCSFLLIGLGFDLVYRTTKFFHFAHGILFTCGAYFLFFFNIYVGFHFYYSILFSIFLCILLGILVDILILQRLRNKGSSSLILLLASLGIYIIMQNIISVLFTDETRTIRSAEVKEGLKFLGARITNIQVVIILVTIALVLFLHLWLKDTKMGTSLRAVANDSELANISGIDSNKIILFTFAISSALAGVAGILMALDIDMAPTMGMRVLMMGVVAVIIGGVDSITGIALGALLLGFAQNFGVWYISSQWQDAIAFGILLVFLLFRPQGFLGKKVKKTTI